MSRELDAEIAERIFGYTLDYEFADMMFDGAPCVKELRSRDDEWGVLPFYSTEIGDAWLVEDEIERRHFQQQYVDTLADMVTTTDSIVEDIIALHGLSDALIIWRILRATPEQRCRAALAAVKEAQG